MELLLEFCYFLRIFEELTDSQCFQMRLFIAMMMILASVMHVSSEGARFFGRKLLKAEEEIEFKAQCKETVRFICIEYFEDRKTCKEHGLTIVNLCVDNNKDKDKIGNQ
eukprot:TRINITY_DN5411_c0_g1_i1.p3 TRINITY_DN5411_c0_g1~~TRINITY_DN5411_c0_g1_i1.p3  ORF type:complete len:109 (-),score=5.10 TRINITY_DN5411_c0_g1_i1:244-570(-)